MIKKIVPLILIIISSLIPLTPAVAYNGTSAKNYLQSHANSPWSTMALSAAGENTITTDHLRNIIGSKALDFSAPILALTSLGKDPKTFGSHDLVANLKSYHTQNQIGDPSTLNDDIFGLLALVAAGEPASDTTRIDAKNFILANQNSDGGWGFAVGSTSDTNMTSSAIAALVSAGVSKADTKIQKATSYLHASQNSDGGFPYDPTSSYGTESDTSSTAWVMWALNAVGIAPASWSQGTNDPITYLESNQAPEGYFKYQTSSTEDSFSPITTSYATIALSGKTLPLHIISNSSSETFNYRIEGANGQLCSGKVAGPTALDVVKNASIVCGYTYHIQEMSFGPYLDQIGDDKAAGTIGWMYVVNNNSPDIGAGDYQLKTGDSVLWFYGDFMWHPSELTLSKGTILPGEQITITVTGKEGSSFAPLSGAQVFYGASSAMTDSNGQAIITPSEGYYKITAHKDGFIRSNTVTLQVGNPSTGSATLSATIGSQGEVNGTSTIPSSTVSFTVNPNTINFGTIDPGSSSSKTAVLTNTGSTDIQIETSVTGDPFYMDTLSVANKSWRVFTLPLSKGNTNSVDLTLKVPSSYANPGIKNGTITFWATAH